MRDLLASPPERGGGLNNWFYRVARVLHPYRANDEISLLLQAATAGERLKPGEIERAVERSRATAWRPGQPAAGVTVPAWPAVNQEQREAVIHAGKGLVDLWEVSPVRVEDNDSHTEEIIDRLFPGNPLLCVGRSKWDFETRSRKTLRGCLAKLQLIVPSPMSARTGHTQEGQESEHTLDNTGPRRFLVIEQDDGNADEQSAILLHLAETRAPLVLAVHSGSKSIHGWFWALGQPEDKLRTHMRYAVSLGADRATWTRSQFVRMPGGTRDNGNPQTVYFFDPGVCQ
ncbi:MAG: hypothetical protein ACR2II_10540 [Chthoniobacterales bacterium]